ncbi:MAG: hypothetical protein ACF8LL_02695, partial [Phycisphaerales bacterium]
DVSLQFILRPERKVRVDAAIKRSGYRLNERPTLSFLDSVPYSRMSLLRYKPKRNKKNWDPASPITYLMSLGVSFGVGPYTDDSGNEIDVVWNQERSEISILLYQSEIVVYCEEGRTLDFSRAAKIVDPIAQEFDFAVAVRLAATNL